MVWRHPFPGPGLGVRCLCLDKAAEVDGAEQLNADIQAFLQEKSQGLSGQVLPIKSVGVQGDVRSYRHPVVLSGTTDWEILDAISPKLTNHFLDLNRVLYHLDSREIESVEVKPAYMTLR